MDTRVVEEARVRARVNRVHMKPLKRRFRRKHDYEAIGRTLVSFFFFGVDAFGEGGGGWGTNWYTRHE